MNSLSVILSINGNLTTWDLIKIYAEKIFLNNQENTTIMRGLYFFLFKPLLEKKSNYENGDWIVAAESKRKLLTSSQIIKMIVPEISKMNRT